MQQKLKQIEDKLQGQIFMYQEKPFLEKKVYKFIKAIIIAGKFRIDTDARQFVLHENEVESFLQKIQIAHEVPYSMRDLEEGNELRSDSVVQSRSKNYKAQMIVGDVISVPEVVGTVSNGLLNMFNNIVSGNATDKQITEAKNASILAGKLIDIEKVRLGYLMLNNK